MADGEAEEIARSILENERNFVSGRIDSIAFLRRKDDLWKRAVRARCEGLVGARVTELAIAEANHGG